MSDRAAVLALYLDGPLQSWGFQSRFEQRTTLGLPTRSGILGMLLAAMGVPKDEASGLERLSPLHMEVVRIGSSKRVTDFHTVGGGMGPTDDRSRVPSTADGGAGRTVVTRREYLADARFGVLLEGDDALLTECKSALSDPKWGVWLGRKSCIPASPLVLGVFANRDEALAALAKASGRKVTQRMVEVTRFEEGTDTLTDVPEDFASRTYRARRVLVEETETGAPRGGPSSDEAPPEDARPLEDE